MRNLYSSRFSFERTDVLEYLEIGERQTHGHSLHIERDRETDRVVESDGREREGEERKRERGGGKKDRQTYTCCM